MPVTFQLVAGNKALHGKIKMKFWVVCIISVLSQLFLTISILTLMINSSKQSGLDTGLGALSLEFEDIFNQCFAAIAYFLGYFADMSDFDAVTNELVWGCVEMTSVSNMNRMMDDVISI